MKKSAYTLKVGKCKDKNKKTPVQATVWHRNETENGAEKNNRKKLPEKTVKQIHK